MRVSKSTVGHDGVRTGVRRPDRGKRLTIADEEAARLDEPAVFAAREGLDVSHQRTVNSTSRDGGGVRSTGAIALRRAGRSAPAPRP